MNIAAIIPARGGSKGIPGKNIRVVGGMPLLAHTIRHAIGTRQIARTIVSTDDLAIGSVAAEYGAEVIMRPQELSSDESSSESALLHVLDTLREREGYEPDLVVFLQATSPLRRPHDISAAIRTLEAEDADSLFSACRQHGFLWRRATDGSLRSFSYDYRNRPRRQDAPEELIENGSIYLFRPRILRELGNRLGGRIAVYMMDPADSFQVDEPADLELAEVLLAARRPAPSVEELRRLRLLVLDFDGVMTDNRVLVNQDGCESVACHRGDGRGIALVRERGVEVFVLSTERNPVVQARARKLGVECLHGCDDKLTELRRLATARGYDATEIAYVGNDVNDLSCLRWVGIPIVVADAEPEVRGVARLVTSRRGGHGAVREVTDWILMARATGDSANESGIAVPGGI